MQAYLERYAALTERMRHVVNSQGRYASRRQAATRGLETAGRDAVCAVSLVEEREKDWEWGGSCFWLSLKLPHLRHGCPETCLGRPCSIYSALLSSTNNIESEITIATQNHLRNLRSCRTPERCGYHAVARPDLAQLFSESYSSFCFSLQSAQMVQTRLYTELGMVICRFSRVSARIAPLT